MRGQALTFGEKRYDGALDDVFAIQTKIAKAVADQLGARFSVAEKEMI